VERDADGQATDVQGPDDFGDRGTIEDSLAIERTLQVDAKSDSMVVAIRLEPPTGRPPGRKKAR